MPYASKVGHRRNTGFMLDAQHHFAGKLCGGAPCTIRHADETGAVRLQFTDSLYKADAACSFLGGEKIKGQAGTGARLQSFSQVHFSLLGLAKYGSASRLHGNHHRFGSFHGDGGGGRSHTGLVFFRHVFLPARRRNNDFIPRLDGFLVIIIKKRITLHVRLEHLPSGSTPSIIRDTKMLPSADSEFCTFKSGWPMDWNGTRLESR